MQGLGVTNCFALCFSENVATAWHNGRIVCLLNLNMEAVTNCLSQMVGAFRSREAGNLLLIISVLLIGREEHRQSVLLQALSVAFPSAKLVMAGSRRFSHFV